jgi:6-phosphofructo-2-kinase/fructose-2,6-biphosphatase 4
MLPTFPDSNFRGTRSSRYAWSLCRKPVHANRSQIIPSSYNNVAKRIKIPGLPDKMVPGSPEDIKMPVLLSGAVSPFSGIGTPQAGSGTATPQLNTPQPLNLRKSHISPSD